jgi:hypothetical protein
MRHQHQQQAASRLPDGAAVQAAHPTNTKPPTPHALHNTHTHTHTPHQQQQVSPGLPGFSPAERQHVGEELSDVLLYLLRLADACGVDLGAAAQAKLVRNAAK